LQFRNFTNDIDFVKCVTPEKSDNQKSLQPAKSPLGDFGVLKKDKKNHPLFNGWFFIVDCVLSY